MQCSNGGEKKRAGRGAEGAELGDAKRAEMSGFEERRQLTRDEGRVPSILPGVDLFGNPSNIQHMFFVNFYRSSYRSGPVCAPEQ